MITPPLQTRRWLIATGIYASLTLLYVWPLLAAFGTRLPSDIGDPGLNTWILWWNSQAMPLTSRWWNAPIFTPTSGAFAFSETLLGVAMLTTPLQWLGTTAVQAYNTAFVLSYLSAALAAHALAYRLTGSHRAALLAGVSFGFNPYRAAQLPHLQMLMSCWLPLGLLALHKYTSDRRTSALLWLSLCWLLNGLTSGYFLTFFAVLVACWMLWYVRTWRELTGISLALTAASLPLAPLLIGYHRHQAALGLSRGLDEIHAFSADLSAIWTASAYAWLPSHWTLEANPEAELYPGAVVLVLVACGVVAAWRRRPRVREIRPSSPGRRGCQLGLITAGCLMAGLALVSWSWGGAQVSIGGQTISTSHPYKSVTSAIWLFVFAGFFSPTLIEAWRRRSTFVFYLLAAAVMFAFALGPVGRVLGARFLYVAPYALLMKLPGGDALRVPARFGVLMSLCLAQAAALAIARRPLRSMPLALLCGAIALEGWMPALKTDPVPPPLSLGVEAGRLVRNGLPLLELPILDLYSDTAAMLRATGHHVPLVNGYSGYEPPDYAVLLQGLREMDPSVLTRQSLLVYVNRAHDDGGHYRAFVNAIPAARLLQEDSAGSLWEVRGGRSAATAIDAAPLSDISVTTRGGTGAGELLVDNNLDTAWRASPDDAIPQEIRLTFARPVSIATLQLNIGPLPVQYPRRLRIATVSVGERGRASVVVWEGGLAGAAMDAVVADRRSLPLRIDLPDAAPATTWTLTVLLEDAKRSWGIRGLKVFGRHGS